MLQNIKSVIGIFLLLFTLLLNKQCIAQSNDYKHPMNDIFESGLFALKSGDTNTAFSNIQAAYTFSSTNEDISYQYIALSLSLDKSNAHLARKQNAALFHGARSR